jgi:hypothetical protein
LRVKTISRVDATSAQNITSAGNFTSGLGFGEVGPVLTACRMLSSCNERQKEKESLKRSKNQKVEFFEEKSDFYVQHVFTLWTVLLAIFIINHLPFPLLLYQLPKIITYLEAYMSIN